VHADLGALIIAGGRACSTSTRLTHPVITNETSPHFAETLGGGGQLAGLLRLGGGEPQAGADLVGLDPDNGALVALGGLPGAGPQAPDHHHPVALGQRVDHMLGEVVPDVDPDVRGLSILPAVPFPKGAIHVGAVDFASLAPQPTQPRVTASHGGNWPPFGDPVPWPPGACPPWSHP
jgi:hypothetical protein